MSISKMAAGKDFPDGHEKLNKVRRDYITNPFHTSTTGNIQPKKLKTRIAITQWAQDGFTVRVLEADPEVREQLASAFGRATRRREDPKSERWGTRSANALQRFLDLIRSFDPVIEWRSHLRHGRPEALRAIKAAFEKREEGTHVN